MSRYKWTEQQLEILYNLYPDNGMEVLTAAIGRNECSIYSKAFALKIKKSEAYAAQLKKESTLKLVQENHKTRFSAGQMPWNLGIKGYMGANKTSFKKGNIPYQTCEIGTERLDKDGRKMIKQSNGHWKYVHVMLWESANGQLPAGQVIKFIDGNMQNLTLLNLKAISRGELMLVNTIYRYPIELQKAIKLNNKLKRKLKNAKK